MAKRSSKLVAIIAVTSSVLSILSFILTIVPQELTAHSISQPVVMPLGLVISASLAMVIVPLAVYSYMKRDPEQSLEVDALRNQLNYAKEENTRLIQENEELELRTVEFHSLRTRVIGILEGHSYRTFVELTRDLNFRYGDTKSEQMLRGVLGTLVEEGKVEGGLVSESYKLKNS